VLKSGMLIAMSVYTYLRLIVDHGTPNLLTLRQKEVDFCISMLREKVIKGEEEICWLYLSPGYTDDSVSASLQFMECLIIGRDLVRLLQNVARIPEMELIWRDLLHNPQVLSPQFTGNLHYPSVLSSPVNNSELIRGYLKLALFYFLVY